MSSLEDRDKKSGKWNCELTGRGNEQNIQLGNANQQPTIAQPGKLEEMQSEQDSQDSTKMEVKNKLEGVEKVANPEEKGVDTDDSKQKMKNCKPWDQGEAN